MLKSLREEGRNGKATVVGAGNAGDERSDSECLRQAISTTDSSSSTIFSAIQTTSTRTSHCAFFDTREQASDD